MAKNTLCNNIGTSLNNEDYDLLIKECLKTGLSISEFVRVVIIKPYIKDIKDGKKR